MPSVNDLQTLAGLSVTVTLLFEIVKRAWQPSEEHLKRFGALLAVGLGVLTAEAAALITGAVIEPQALFQAALTGVFAGGLASGLYSLAQASPLPTYKTSDAGLP